MKKFGVIAFFVMLCIAFCGAQIHLHPDTLDAKELTHKADDTYLLELVNRQGERIAAREDSIRLFRMANDTTTIIPLHLGFVDSIRCAQNVRRQGGTTMLCMPQLYRPAEPLRFETLQYVTKQQPAPVFKPFLERTVRGETRKYLNAHAADIYVGLAKPIDREYLLAEQKSSVYELNISQRFLVKDIEEERREYLNAVKNRNNPWFKEANLLLQFTQNYVSPNWYEGGNSSFSMYASAKGTLKYDDKKRITWESYGEWTAGVSTVSGDSLRIINCSEDLFRLYSKLGVKIVPKLYGSFSVDYRMQMFPTFKTNSRNIKTGFATPIRFNLALGLDYKPVKGLSIVFSPAAFKLVHANDTVRAPYTSYGIPQHKKTLAEFGSSTRVEWMWKPVREVSLDTKFYAYTNYRMIELDLEVTCDFIINRFITTRVILHPRYDSSLIHEGDSRAKMQFKELVSIGFAHKFY